MNLIPLTVYLKMITVAHFMLYVLYNKKKWGEIMHSSISNAYALKNTETRFQKTQYHPLRNSCLLSSTLIDFNQYLAQSCIYGFIIPIVRTSLKSVLHFCYAVDSKLLLWHQSSQLSIQLQRKEMEVRILSGVVVTSLQKAGGKDKP